MKKIATRDWLASIALLAVVIGAWWLASQREWVSKVFLPTPEAAFTSLLDGLRDGDLVAYTLATAGRMVVGWFVASLLGIGLGALIGSSAAARRWLQSTLEFIRPLPASAMLPIAAAIFGLSPGMVLFVVAFGAMWPVLLGTIHGFASVHARLGEVGRALQLSRSAFALKIALPNAMPDILAGMRLSLTVSLIVSVVGEMIASQAGLGQAILLAARSYRASELFAGVILLGAVGFVSNAALGASEHRLLHWQRP